jgi:hypothetical protein
VPEVESPGPEVGRIAGTPIVELPSVVPAPVPPDDPEVVEPGPAAPEGGGQKAGQGSITSVGPLPEELLGGLAVEPAGSLLQVQ